MSPCQTQPAAYIEQLQQPDWLINREKGGKGCGELQRMIYIPIPLARARARPGAVRARNRASDYKVKANRVMTACGSD